MENNIKPQIADRRSCFYWQTDRNLSVEDYDKYFLKRQQISNDKLVEVLKQVKCLGSVQTVQILEPDTEVVKGNVNIVRKVEINGTIYVARIHPFGIKNGYFYVEQLALARAKLEGLPVPEILEVHEAQNENDLDFVLLTTSPGTTMESTLKENSVLESKLLFQGGSLMAKIHMIKVDGFGSFDNQIAKNERKLSGLHGSYKEFIWCGLDENLQRLVAFEVFDKAQADKFREIFVTNNFEPLDGPRLIHNDFADWNLLVDDESISAVLDWDECHAGDPIADLACWSTFFNLERFSTFLEGYKSIATLPNDFEKRFHFYRLRYTISKMALRIKRAQVDHSEGLKERIKVGKLALEEEVNWFNLNPNG